MRPGLLALAAALLCSVAAPVQSQEAADPAVELAGSYTLDVLANTRGGLARETRALHLLAVELTVDGDRTTALPDGSTVHASALYTTGGEFAAEVVGDYQVVSNIDAPEALRLYEAWYEQRLSAERGSIKLGLIDLNADFDVNETGALFMGSSHGVGADLGQTGENGPSIFPRPGVGVRAELTFGEAASVAFGAYEAVPGDPNRPGSARIRIDDGEGALLIGEARLRRATSVLKAGLWGYTRRTDRLDPGLEDQGRSAGGYVLAETCWRGATDDCSVATFARAGVASESVNPAGAYLGAGVVVRPVASRPADALGLAVAAAVFGDGYRQSRAVERLPTDDAEIAVELTYRAQLTPRFAVQPNLQWISNPSGDPALGDALVAGVRFDLR